MFWFLRRKSTGAGLPRQASIAGCDKVGVGDDHRSQLAPEALDEKGLPGVRPTCGAKEEDAVGRVVLCQIVPEKDHLEALEFCPPVCGVGNEAPASLPPHGQSAERGFPAGDDVVGIEAIAEAPVALHEHGMRIARRVRDHDHALTARRPPAPERR